MDRGVTAGGIQGEGDTLAPNRPLHPYPPVLTAEKAAAVRDIKPFLRAVADVNRVAILQELGREGGLNVLDLAERVALSQPLTSWHLHILRRARLVSITNLGRQHIYRLNRQRLLEYADLFGTVIDV